MFWLVEEEEAEKPLHLENTEHNAV